MTIEYLGLREGLYNPDFKPLEFEGVRKEMSVSQTELAARMKASRPSVSKVLHGEINITFASAVRFAKVLQLGFFPQLVRPATGEFYAHPSGQHFSAMRSAPMEIKTTIEPNLDVLKITHEVTRVKEVV